MFVDFNILNQLGSPSINSNTFANRPAAGQTGRLFVSTDTFEIYRDNGTTWDLIGGPGSSTITGTGTATQVAYFTSSQAIGSSANLFWDNTNTRLGVGIAVPSGIIHADGGASAARMILDADTGVARIFSFRTDNLPRWALRVDGTETGSNAGADFNLRAYDDTGAFTFTTLTVLRATGKTSWQATQTYTTGLARGNYFDYNLSVSAGGSFSSPNAITALGASLDLTLAGSATIPSGARSGLDAYNSIGFTGTGTLTHTQGTQIRAYSNVTAGWAFNGSATGTITHLAGLRALFPDNTGSAVTVTNNYALLLNDQTANTGTVTYTNRWGIYQEGTSDLNYMAANLLLGSTTNSGEKLQVTGTSKFTGNLAVDTNVLFVDTANDRVGIGTTSPSTKLAVSGAIALDGTSSSQPLNGGITRLSNGYTYFVGSSTGNGSILSNGDGSATFRAFSPGGSNGYLTFETGTGTERARFTSGGNTLIGTTTDAGQKLQVNGTSYLINDLKVGNDVVKVDTTNLRVGINKTTPQANLEIGSAGSHFFDSFVKTGSGAASYDTFEIIFGNDAECMGSAVIFISYTQSVSGVGQSQRVIQYVVNKQTSVAAVVTTISDTSQGDAPQTPTTATTAAGKFTFTIVPNNNSTNFCRNEVSILIMGAAGIYTGATKNITYNKL